jgi:hypothetical protein
VLVFETKLVNISIFFLLFYLIKYITFFKCPFLISGNCGYGDSCLYLHGIYIFYRIMKMTLLVLGNPCPVCLKPCLHPTRADLSEGDLKNFIFILFRVKETITKHTLILAWKTPIIWKSEL